MAGQDDTKAWMLQRNAAARNKRTGPATPLPGQEALDQFAAGAHGAGDALTFGLDDNVSAGVQALSDMAKGRNFGQSYETHMAAERAQDAYDRTHYGAARTIGQVIGTGAQIAALGPAEGLAMGGARIAEATPLIAREVGLLGGAGAAAGVGGQAISDVATSHVSSPGDYAGAGVGGAVNALVALRGGAGYAGAAGGAATSMAQDVFNGRMPSIDRARDAAVTGGLLGTVAGVGGRVWSNRLSNAEKEKIGEGVSRLRTAARGDSTLPGRKTAEHLPGYTIPDQRTAGGEIVESKFGRKSGLSPRQIQAHNQLPNYRVDQSLPRDVGALYGFPAAQLGYFGILNWPGNQSSQTRKY